MEEAVGGGRYDTAMIDPLPKDEPYPGRLPPLRIQWRRVSRPAQFAIVGGPVLVVVILVAANAALGAVVGVMFAGVGLASVVYAKNRTDQHNAAVDRGEIRVAADPHLRREAPGSVDQAVRERLAGLGFSPDDTGQVTGFDGGWIVKRRNRRDVSVVVGNDGGFAYFDPRWVDDLRAATEYRAGRGREPGSP
jgi:hypothetical protein